MLVYPTHIACNVTAQERLDCLMDISTGHHYFQASEARLLISRRAHATTQENITILNGSKHSAVSTMPVHPVIVVLRVVIVMGLGAGFLRSDATIDHAKNLVSGSHPEMNAEGFAILGCGCNFHSLILT
jgi:hypothetical protein